MQKKSWHQLIIDKWQHFRQKSPLYYTWAILALGMILYYFLVILTTNHATINLAINNKADLKNIEWMATVGKEIITQRKFSQDKQNQNNESTFTLVNQAIDEKDWNSLVSNLQQTESNNVRLRFNTINFNELMTWLQQLYSQTNIYPSEAIIEKKQPGIVSATLTLKSDP